MLSQCHIVRASSWSPDITTATDWLTAHTDPHVSHVTQRKAQSKMAFKEILDGSSNEVKMIKFHISFNQ